MAARKNRDGWLAAVLGAASGLVALAFLRARFAPDVVDLRHAARNVTYRKGQLAGEVKRTYRRKRDLADVDGIVLHQWGVSSVGTGAHRKVTAHLSVGHDGTVYYVHPFETWLASAPSMNGTKVHIEVAGLYGRDSIVPAATIRGAQAAVKFARQEMRRQGGTLRDIWAHRQTQASRAMDPGPDIWRRVAVPSGLTMHPDETRNQGKPLTDIWLGRGLA